MHWKELLKDNIVKVDDLAKVLNISSEEKEKISRISNRHPMSITKYYFDLIDWIDENDPIRKLSVPDEMELNDYGDYDTSGESTNTKMQGLQHKYEPTALVLSTNVCYTYCRHCFRKRMVGYSANEINKRMEQTVAYVKEHEEINNVLITGGDSFTLSNDVIEDYLKNLLNIDHLDFIRFGTRVPVVFPQRIYMDEEFLSILKKYSDKKEIVVVTQFNHPRELTTEVKKGVQALRDAGCIIRNQTVLLKGINDDSNVMADLLQGLTAIGIHPYYIFQCRPVKYSTHFQVSLYDGLELLSETKKKLNGISKGFRYIMSHLKGKIEILGKTDGNFIFKFHQSKNNKNADKIFVRSIEKDANWLSQCLNLS